MRKALRRVFVASLIPALLLATRSAWAWGNTGHEAVAYVAWNHMDQATRDRIFALLQQVPSVQNAEHTITIPGFAEWSASLPAGLTEDQQHMYIFMRAATWPDSVKHHFFQDSDTPPSDLAKAQANIGFTDRESHGYWHFIDTPVGTAQSGSTLPALPSSCRKNAPQPVASLPDAPGTNAVSEITLLSGALASDEEPALKAYDLIWLEHLVGDVHQPLHATVRFVQGIPDIGGNCVAISVPKPISTHFVPAGGKGRPPAELHAFWDDLPGTGTQMDTQLAATYAAKLPPAPEDQATIADPTTWAQESFDVASRDAYTAPVLVGFGSPKAYIITTAYYNTAYKDAQQRIALAGIRLANLLTEALNPASAAATVSSPQ